MDNQAKETPILDLLDNVPIDARQMYEHTSTHHQNIPFGRLATKAAGRIRELEEEIENLKHDLSSYMKIANIELNRAAGLEAEVERLKSLSETATKRAMQEQARAEAAEAEVERLRDENRTLHRMVNISPETCKYSTPAILEAATHDWSNRLKTIERRAKAAESERDELRQQVKALAARMKVRIDPCGFADELESILQGEQP